MNTNSNYQHINTQQLLQLQQLMGEIFDELIPSYIEGADALFTNADSLFESADITTLERLSHSLKSSSRNVGANSLGDAAETLEMLAREKNLTEYINAFSEVKQLYQQVKSELLKFDTER